MFLGACRRRRRRGGFQLYQLRAAWGATGQLSGIRLGLWVSRFRGCRAKRLYLHNRGPGAAPGGVASKNGWGHMRVQGGFISYGYFVCGR